MDKRFTDIIHLIKLSRTNAFKVINAELINLYWNIGEYISKKINKSEWGDSVVTELAKYIQQNEPEIKGFSDKNIWRMKQFYETYKGFPKLSTLLREISWSHNLAIFSRCKTNEEREFYLKLAKQENYSFRELDRQISASHFERFSLSRVQNLFSRLLVCKELSNHSRRKYKIYGALLKLNGSNCNTAIASLLSIYFLSIYAGY